VINPKSSSVLTLLSRAGARSRALRNLLLSTIALTIAPITVAEVYELSMQFPVSLSVGDFALNDTATLKIEYTDQSYGTQDTSAVGDIGGVVFYYDSIVSASLTVGPFIGSLDPSSQIRLAAVNTIDQDDPSTPIQGYVFNFLIESNSISTDQFTSIELDELVNVSIFSTGGNGITAPRFPNLPSPADLPAILAQSRINYSFFGLVAETADGDTQTERESGIEVQDENVTLVLSTDDADSDGIVDAQDNCSRLASLDTRDGDADGIGNLCDADLNNDCFVNVQDLGMLRSLFFSSNPSADFNSDGVVNVQDLGILRLAFFDIPGYSGVNNDCQFGTRVPTIEGASE